MPIATRLQTALSKPFMPAIFFFAGVAYDTVTLTRIDRLLDNLILLGYLTLLGVLIVLTGRATLARPQAQEASAPEGRVQAFLSRAQPYYPNAIQFLLGGVFSAYTIFYSQSASLSTTAVFFCLLVGLLVANEFLRNRLSSLKLLIGLYAVVCFSFFTFSLPILIRFMNTFVFLLGAVLSLAVALWLVELIYKGTSVPSTRERVLTGLPATVLVALLVGFYFLNWIPPVPLSLKFGGIYHHITKQDGMYRLGFEKGAWYQFWKRSDDPFRGEGPVYCFTAVFAPVDLRTVIVHHWQYRGVSGPSSTEFSTADKIPIEISGGREAGYRAYTVKTRLLPGDWRVNVETGEGRVIGLVDFRVEEGGPEVPEIQTISY